MSTACAVIYVYDVVLLLIYGQQKKVSSFYFKDATTSRECNDHHLGFNTTKNNKKHECNVIRSKNQDISGLKLWSHSRNCDNILQKNKKRRL